MDFQITLIGLNHRSASVDIRERYALGDFCAPDTWALPLDDYLHESFILSTCNRVEILGISPNNPQEHMLNLWAKVRKESQADLERHIYIYHNLDAVRHVFEVASSLDSMVLGEPQILGQMKEAYRKAVTAKKTGSILNSLMHRAFTVAKRVRNETAVAASAVSISYAAVELAKRIFGSMPGHKAMLIGAGEMAELAAMHLLQAGIDEIIVINRTFKHGQELAERFKGHAIPFEQLAESFKDVDIVIASTGSPDPIVGKKEIQKALKARKNSPMFFIDIAVPRDVDPEINTLDNVYLYDIDDLKEVVEENIAGRKDEATKAKLIINEEVALFGDWLESLASKPTILELIKRGEEACNKELARAFKRLGSLDPEQKEAIETMAKALTKKLNHEPLMFLKHQGMGKDSFFNRVDMVRKVFNLDSRRDK